LRHEKFIADTAWPVDLEPLALAVIIPTFNEAANVEKLLTRLNLVLAGISWEAIFVDDNSTDGTADLIRSIGRNNVRVRVVQRIGRRGLSSAVVEGMLATSAPVLAVIDGDMQHDEALLPLLFGDIASGKADLSIGTRYSKGGGVGDWDVRRQRISRWATGLGQRFLGVELSDPMSGFFALSRDALMQAMPKLSGVGFKLLLDIVASSPEKLRVTEHCYQFRSREAGESKLDARVGLEYFNLLIDKTAGRYVPTRLINFLIVGGIGVGVHIALLWSAILLQASFLVAQSLAVWGAMTFNFALNNVFTYRDRRLRGWAALRGLLSFYAVCLVGAVANVGVGVWVNDHDGRWLLAGLAGVVLGAVWNYAASSALTWRK
jgi:dolichol-phosphate mannosyltransferase